MKKGFLISLVAASLLSVAQAADYGRMHTGLSGMIDVQEHAQEARSSAMGQASSAHSTAMGQASSAHSAMGMNNDSDDDSDSDMDYDEDAMKHAQEARSSAMGQASSAHSTAMEHAQENHRNRLLEMVEAGEIPDTLPPETKEVLKEVKKAVKFAKHPELFADLNITDPVALKDPQTLQKIEERVQEAFKKRSQEVAHKLIDNQPKRELPVAGDFVKIGEGQYDWAFVTTSGHVYKLVGVSEDGKFKYQPLGGVKGEIAPDGTVTFDGQNPSVDLPKEPLPGYPFAKYDDPNENGFDWIVATKSGHVYKLEGFDEDNQSFFYTPVEGLKAQQQGDEVVILPEDLPGS